MRIQINDVSPVMYGTSAKGKQFKKIDVSYFSGGKQYNKTLTQYSDAFGVLVNALPDEQFSLDLEKNGQFTEWKNVQKIDGEGEVAAAPEAVAKTQQKSTGKSGVTVRKTSSVEDPRETAAEREVRQRKISRQACLNTAVEYLKLNKMPEGAYGGPGVEGVLAVAQQFLDFVNETMEVSNGDKAE